MNSVEIVQLSSNTTVIAFNKTALAALKDGKAQVVELKQGKKITRVLIMRDTEFNAKMSEFRQHYQAEDAPKPIKWMKVIKALFSRKAA